MVNKKNKEVMNLDNSEYITLNPYDEQYPIELLSNGLKLNLGNAEEAVSRIYNSLSKDISQLAQIKEATKRGFRLVVDATEQTLSDIDSGKIKLTSTKDGALHAQIRQPNGQYGKKLPIKKQVYAKGIDPVQMANAMQMKAIQSQLQDMATKLETIDYSVQEVLQGQQNDRIGLYYSGLSLYAEARTVRDPEMRKALVSQSLLSLSEAKHQLEEQLQSDILYLKHARYKKDKGNQAQKIIERMDNIYKSFAFIHQSTVLKAGIYCGEGELPAMATVLLEYKNFIDNTIKRNIDILIGHDIRDKGTGSGKWKTIAALQIDVSEILNSLENSDKTLYLEMVEEENNG